MPHLTDALTRLPVLLLCQITAFGSSCGGSTSSGASNMSSPLAPAAAASNHWALPPDVDVLAMALTETGAVLATSTALWACDVGSSSCARLTDLPFGPDGHVSQVQVLTSGAVGVLGWSAGGKARLLVRQPGQEEWTSVALEHEPRRVILVGGVVYYTDGTNALYVKESSGERRLTAEPVVDVVVSAEQGRIAARRTSDDTLVCAELGSGEAEITWRRLEAQGHLRPIGFLASAGLVFSRDRTWEKGRGQPETEAVLVPCDGGRGETVLWSGVADHLAVAAGTIGYVEPKALGPDVLVRVEVGGAANLGGL